VDEGITGGVCAGGNVDVTMGRGETVDVGAGLYKETGTPAQDTAVMRMNIITKKRRMVIL
jgi:hypothetical protein